MDNNKTVYLLPCGAPVLIKQVCPLGDPKLVEVHVPDEVIASICPLHIIKFLEEVSTLEKTLVEKGLHVVNEIVEELN